MLQAVAQSSEVIRLQRGFFSFVGPGGLGMIFQAITFHSGMGPSGAGCTDQWSVHLLYHLPLQTGVETV